MHAKEFVEKFASSMDVNTTEIADLVEILYSNGNVFFEEVMTLLQKRHELSTGKNCTVREISSKVWNALFWQAKFASRKGENKISKRIMKVIFDGSETLPWEYPRPDYDFLTY